MQSTKMTWRDWLRESRANFKDLPVPLSLRESDWVALVQVLLAPNVSREAVRAALQDPME